MTTRRLSLPMGSIHPILTPLFALFILIAASLRTTAQSGVTVTFFRPPPNQLKTTDLYRVRLNNTTGAPIPVTLFGTCTEATAGRIVEATSRQFDLQPGLTVITGPELQPIDADYFSEKHKQVFLRTGQAPTGEYTVCIFVRRASDNAQLATDCYTQRVQTATPPILIVPPDGETVTAPVPTFTWTAPTPLVRGQQVRYKLRIVEILGRQTAFDAMQSNPSWFERDEITTRTFPLPLSARKLRVGDNYAWQVSAFDGDTRQGDFPLGRSEIWSFTYGRSEGDTRLTTVDTALVRGTTRVTTKSFKTKPLSLIEMKAFDISPIRVIVSPEIVPRALLDELTRSCFGD